MGVQQPPAGVGNRRRAGHAVALSAFGVLLPVALFLLLAEGVAGGLVRDLDEGVLHAMADIRNAALTVFMRIVTFLGGDWGVAIPTIATVVVLLTVSRPRLREAVFVIAVMTGAGILQLVTKLIFERPRPDVFEPLVTVSTYSYPSGHAMASAAPALAVAVVAWPTRWRTETVVGVVFFVLLVALSRLYLGVHYPSDIVAGWLLAVAWVACVRLAFAAARRPVGGRCAAGARVGGDKGG